MTKRKYLRKLRKALGRIPESEKEELIEYYAEIIDESYERGKTTREIFATLETPEQVASDYFNANEGRMNERRRRPTRDEFFSRGRDDDDDYDEKTRRRRERDMQYRPPEKKRSVVATILLIPFYIVAFVLGIALAIVCAAMVIAAVALVIAGIYTLVMSFGLIPSNGMLAITQIGAAFALFGVAMLFELTVKPLAFGTGAFFRTIFGQKQRGGAAVQSHWLRFLVFAILFLIIGGVMGGIGFNALGNNWENLAATGEWTERTEKADLLNGEVVLRADNMRVRIVPSDEAEVVLKYTECSEFPLTYTSSEEGMSLSAGEKQFHFWENVKTAWSHGVLFSTVVSYKSEATIYLPQMYVGNLTVAVNNGKLVMGDEEESWQALGNVQLETDNGMIEVKNLSAANVSASADNGYLGITRVSATGSVTLETQNGAVNLIGVTANAVNAKAQNGAIYLEKLDAETIELRTQNGAVKGTLAGMQEDYKITASVQNGSCNLTDSITGIRSLNASTQNGAISLAFLGN